MGVAIESHIASDMWWDSVIWSPFWYDQKLYDSLGILGMMCFILFCIANGIELDMSFLSADILGFGGEYRPLAQFRWKPLSTKRALAQDTGLPATPEFNTPLWSKPRANPKFGLKTGICAFLVAAAAVALCIYMMSSCDVCIGKEGST